MAPLFCVLVSMSARFSAYLYRGRQKRGSHCKRSMAMSRIRRPPGNTDGSEERLGFGKLQITAMLGADLTVERPNQRFALEDAEHPRHADIGLWVRGLAATACGSSHTAHGSVRTRHVLGPLDERLMGLSRTAGYKN